jgi:hypothetical protein
MVIVLGALTCQKTWSQEVRVTLITDPRLASLDEKRSGLCERCGYDIWAGSERCLEFGHLILAK